MIAQGCLHAHTARYTSAKMQICASRSSSAASSRDVTALSLAISAVRRWIIASAHAAGWKQFDCTKLGG